MNTGQIIFILFGVLIAAFGVWRYLPKTMFYFTPGAVKGSYHPGAGLDPKPAARAEETLEAMALAGFVPAGVQLEKPPLWSKPLEVQILTGTEGTELACVIPGKRHVTWYFETLFEGGQMVITAQSGFKPVNEGGLYQSVPEVATPADLLARHRENVAHFVSQGQTPVPRYTDDVIEGSTGRYYGFPVVQRGMRTYGSMNAVPLVILCIPLVLALV